MTLNKEQTAALKDAVSKSIAAREAHAALAETFKNDGRPRVWMDGMIDDHAGKGWITEWLGELDRRGIAAE